jgi:hypothetical protein
VLLTRRMITRCRREQAMHAASETRSLAAAGMACRPHWRSASPGQRSSWWRPGRACLPTPLEKPSATNTSRSNNGGRPGAPISRSGSTSHRKVRSVNPILKRRYRVVGIFLNDASITRLVGAVLLELKDQWQLECRRMFSAQNIAVIPWLKICRLCWLPSLNGQFSGSGGPHRNASRGRRMPTIHRPSKRKT